MANTTKTIDAKSAVNLARQTMTPQAQSLLPMVTAESLITDVSNPVMEYSIVKNELATNLIDVIGLTVLDTITNFTNKLTKFKKKTTALGIDVREIASGLVSGQNYDFSVDGIAKMFKLYPAEYQECFHRLNRQRMFPITFSEREFKLALNSWEDLNAFINNIANTLYQSNYIEEYESMLLIIKSAFEKDNIKYHVIDKITDDNTAKTFVKTVMNIADSFEFPDKSNSVFGRNNTDTSIIPISNKEDTAIIMPYTVRNDIKLDVLLTAFNKDEVAFNVDTLTTVDDLGYIKGKGDDESKFYKVDALICDKNFLQFYDYDDNGINGNDLPTVRGYNRYLHIWQTLSTSPFVCANIVVHEVEESEVPTGYFDSLITE